MKHFPLTQSGGQINVSGFYAGKDVFITGATGFMGKVLLEKLLWACEDIGTIYVLIRVKKGIDPQKRINKILELPAFDRLRNRDPDIFKKIIPICGDVSEPSLGISEEDKTLLETNISIIFHAASSVRFDDPLKKAIIINVRGTKELIDLAKNMKQLEVFLYISTSYCNSQRPVIEEEVIQAQYDWKEMIQMAEKIEEHILNVVEPKVLNGHPNTYTFTKSLAENVVKDYASEVPMIVVKPSIVTYCAKEPIRGWVDNLNGPIGFSAAGGIGLVHTFIGDEKSFQDYIPCDYAINGIILAAWYKATCGSKEFTIMNCASGTKMKIPTTYVISKFKDVFTTYPGTRMLWFPTIMMISNKLLFHVLFITMHIIPGLLLDGLLKMAKVDFSVMRVIRKVFIASRALSYFSLNGWKIVTTKYDSMHKLLSAEDRKMFNYDPSELDFEEFLMTGALGLKMFIFKDDMSCDALERDRKKAKRLYWVHNISKCLFVLTILWITSNFLYSRMKPIIEES